MGFFSWQASDTRETIWNRHVHDGATPCKMLLPDGTVYEEDDYDGYGVFGGHDFYVEVALLNGFAADRDKGISLMDVNRYESAPPGVIAPKLVTMGCTLKYEDLPHSETCRTQGYWG